MSDHFSPTQIFDSFPSAVYICDHEGKITYYNNRAVELWGRTPVLNNAQEVFCACYKVYTLDGQFVPREMVPMVEALQRGKTIKNIKAIVERPNGSRIIAQVSISPIRNEREEVIGAINIFQDITQQHVLEKNLEKINQELKWTTEELEQMVYCVSHDLREPLRVASTYIQLLSQKYEGQLDAKADNYITTAVKSCDRVRHLINDLLTFSRVRGEYSSFQRVDLNKALSQALLGLKLVIGERGALITQDHLPYVFGDEAKISLVFQNLIGNAIKFCKHKPEIHILAKNNEEGVTIGIKDNGIGIDPGDKEKVFDVFKRLHSTSEYAGTGMGLAICKKIIEQHKGSIWFDSTTNEGTTFSFTLCHQQSPNAPDKERFSTVLGTPSLDPLKTASSARHVVQIYKNIDQYSKNLTLFAATGLEKNEALIILATSDHWKDLQNSLTRKGFDVEHLILEGRINFIDAEGLFSELIKDGEDKFAYHFSMVGQEIIINTLRKFTKFRAFGELVDVLCAHGKMGIAVEVEKVWHRYVQEYDFTLFCAYFSENLKNTSDPSQVIHICENHSHLLSE